MINWQLDRIYSKVSSINNKQYDFNKISRKKDFSDYKQVLKKKSSDRN